MNTGRLVGASLVVWIVRALLNFLFYGVLTTAQYAAISDAHPGVFREVIPAFIAADLLFAIVFVFLFAKVSSCLGGGIKAGLTLGILVAILSPLLGSIYMFYSFTLFPAGLMATDAIFQLASHAVSGVLAAVVYKS